MARFNPTKYSPETDSSAGSSKFRKGAIENDVLLTVDEGKTCPSGNGKPVSPKRTFSQGGDARLKGILQRASATGTKITTLDPKGKVISTKDASAVADSYGFGKYVTAFAQRTQAQEADRQARATALATKRIEAAAASAARRAERQKAQDARTAARASKKASAAKATATKRTASKRAPAKKAVAKPAVEALAEANAAAN